MWSYRCQNIWIQVDQIWKPLVFIDNYLCIIIRKIERKHAIYIRRQGFLSVSSNNTHRQGNDCLKEDIFYSYISLGTGTALPNQEPHSETLNSTRGEKNKRESRKVFIVGFSGRNKNFGGSSGFRWFGWIKQRGSWLCRHRLLSLHINHPHIWFPSLGIINPRRSIVSRVKNTSRCQSLTI